MGMRLSHAAGLSEIAAHETNVCPREPGPTQEDGDAYYRKAGVSSCAAVRAAIEPVVVRYGCFNVPYNNAGGAGGWMGDLAAAY